MIASVKASLASLVDYRVPQGGLFMWLKLKQPVSAKDLLEKALEQGVSFAPGNRFLIEETDYVHNVRLNFTYQPEEAIRKGIERMGTVLGSFS